MHTFYENMAVSWVCELLLRKKSQLSGDKRPDVAGVAPTEIQVFTVTCQLFDLGHLTFLFSISLICKTSLQKVLSPRLQENYISSYLQIILASG